MLCTTFCRLSFVFLFLFVRTPSVSASGGWAATYGGAHNDSSSSIQQTSDGGYIVAGRTNSFGAGDTDLLVLKLQHDGVVEWQKTYGRRSWDVADSIQQTADGGYIVAGKTGSFAAKNIDFWVLKLRADGTVEWQKTYGGFDIDWTHYIQQTSDGGYIAAGETKSFGVGRGDLWVLKLGADGTVEWQKTYGGVASDVAESIHQTHDGGYIVAGETTSFGAGREDFWILKLRPDGTVEWEKTYGGVGNDRAYSVQQTSDGKYIVAGETWSFGAGGNLWILKLRAEGTVEWQKTYAGVTLHTTHSLRRTSDGGYIVVGETEFFSAGETDFLITKFWPDGTVEWQKTYGGVYSDLAPSIQNTCDGGCIVAGYTRSFDVQGSDLLILKLRSDGSVNPSCSFIIVLEPKISGEDTHATVENTHAGVLPSNAKPQNSLALVQDTNLSVNILCP